MRALWLGAAACLCLSACDKPAEPAPAAPAVKKSLARQAPFYAGQEQITAIDSGSVAPGAPGTLMLKVDGKVPSAGYTGAGFKPRVYAAAPRDGIYEVDVVADKPSGQAAAAETPIHVEGAWSGYKQDRLKGVKLIAKTNEVVAMLPAGQ
jgi:hypothetical protein